MGVALGVVAVVAVVAVLAAVVVVAADPPLGRGPGRADRRRPRLRLGARLLARAGRCPRPHARRGDRVARCRRGAHRDRRGRAAARRRGRPGSREDEIERTLLQMPSHPDLRALEVVYRYRLDDVDETSKLPRTALTVALRSEGETIGSLAAISRSVPSGFSEATEGALQGLARRAGPAIWNALRYAEARELAELDSLTGLHNRRLFYEFLSREIARAHRYERYVSVIVFDLDDFKRINDRIGHLEGDARPRRGRRPRPHRRPRDRYRLPGRRRRVRGHPARVEPRRRRAARRPDRDRDPRPEDRRRSGR